MHRLAIEAWAQETLDLATAETETPAPTPTITATAPTATTTRPGAAHGNRKRKRVLQDADASRLNRIDRGTGSEKRTTMSSPNKHLTTDRTPRPIPPPQGTRRPGLQQQHQQQHQQQQPVTPLSFAATLATLPDLDVSPTPRKRRRTSPSKRYQTTASLGDLRRPVKLVKIKDGKNAIPADARRLYDALVAVSFNVATLPSFLKEAMGQAAVDDAGIQPFMWQPEPPQPQGDGGAVLQEYSHILGMIDEAVDSANMARSEAAWNVQVHYPVLRQLVSPFSAVKVETITSAQISKPFRPFHSGARGESSASSAASTQSSALGDDGASNAGDAPSIHKMVDFAIALMPDDHLKAVIDNFLSQQDHRTVNQTMYEPLRCRPAPVFIETKTSSGSMDSSHVQLGVWTAAWHERFRSISQEARVITIPVIQVYGSVWNVLFAVDAGAELHLLDQDLRIGDTSTVTGMYQLRAAMAAIAGWMSDDFRPWFSNFLQDNMESRVPDAAVPP